MSKSTSDMWDEQPPTKDPLNESKMNTDNKLDKLYDCQFCDGEKENWNLKTEAYEQCPCVDKLQAIKANYRHIGEEQDNDR